MLKEKTGIGPGLLFCLVFSSVFGYGIMQAPFMAAKYIGANGYWGIILAFLLAIAFVLTIFHFVRRFPRRSIIEYSQKLVGKPVGILLGGLYLLFLLAVMIWALQAVTTDFKLYFLPRTPPAAIMIIILLSNLYLAYQGIEVVTRLASFLFPLALVFIIANTALSFQDFHPDNIRPVLDLEPGRLALGAMQLFNIFFPLAALFGLSKYLTKPPRAPRAVMVAAGMATFFILLIVLATVGTYGAGTVQQLTWPSIELSRQSNVPYILLTFSLFFSVVRFVELFIALGCFYFLISQGCAELIGMLDYKRFTLILFLPIVLSVMSMGSTVRMFRFFDWLRPAGFCFLFSLAVVLLIASYLKRGGAQSAS